MGLPIVSVIVPSYGYASVPDGCVECVLAHEGVDVRVLIVDDCSPASGHNCISSPEVVVRTSVQRAVGGYDPGCTHASDLNMWLRAMASRALARQALWRATRAVDQGLLGGDDAFPMHQVVAFALDVHPRARELREWRGLQLRRRLGPGRSPFFPLFLATGPAHGMHLHLRRLRWAPTGI